MSLDQHEDDTESEAGTRAPGEADRFHRRVYETVADADLSFAEKVERLLTVGCDRFDLEYGLFCRIRDGTVTVQRAVGDHDRLRTGATVDSGQPYCHGVAMARQPVAIESVDDSEKASGLVAEDTGLGACFGTPVELDGQRYGSLCFGSDQPRDQPFTDAEHTFLELLSEWLRHELDRHCREGQLAAVNDLSRSLMEDETVEAVAERVAAAAPGLLDLPVAGLALYDDATGRLEPAPATDRLMDLLGKTSVLDPDDGQAWQAFLAGETRVVDLADAESEGGTVTDLAVVPLCDDGVFLTGSTAPDGFGDADLEFVETVAATVQAALDRADREQQLQERERALAEKTGTLERLNRINGIIRTIDQALVGAATPSEIREVVCEKVASVGGYELAWVGVSDGATDTVEPVEWAGTDAGYLDGISVRTDDDPEAQGPVGRAVTTREPRVVDSVVEDDSFAPWRDAALDRGFQAVIALPLVYRERLYGVLAVYADQPGEFGDLETTVLAEMSDTVAYALNAVESKQALVSDRVTELEFTVDGGPAAADLTRTAGGSIAVEEIVPRSDGGFRCFVRTRGISDELAREACHRLPVTGSDLISKREEDGEVVCLYEADLAANSIPATVIEHGGRPTAMTAETGTVSLTVELGGDTDVRGFVEAIERAFPTAELVAQHTRKRVERTACEYRADLTEDLTDRQLEALQTAYYSGYFERPRPRTASDIADRMDITQPTFTAHLRAAERHLCAQVFDEGGDGDGDGDGNDE